MTICSMCGHESEAGSRFCSACGIALPTGNQPTGVFDVSKANETTEIPIVNPKHINEIAGGNAVLVVTKGALEGVRFTLNTATGDSITIGRSPESTIFLDDVTVSRQHATLMFTEEGWVLSDSGSLNGTYVNRQLISAAVLSNNDDVQIGKYRLAFLDTKGQV